MAILFERDHLLKKDCVFPYLGLVCLLLWNSEENYQEDRGEAARSTALDLVCGKWESGKWEVSLKDKIVLTRETF